jgi:hypothetical protein
MNVNGRYKYPIYKQHFIDLVLVNTQFDELKSHIGVPGTYLVLRYHMLNIRLFVSLRWIASISCAPQRTNYCHTWKWTTGSSVNAVRNPAQCTYNTRSTRWQKTEHKNKIQAQLHQRACSDTVPSYPDTSITLYSTVVLGRTPSVPLKTPHTVL